MSLMILSGVPICGGAYILISTMTKFDEEHLDLSSLIKLYKLLKIDDAD